MLHRIYTAGPGRNRNRVPLTPFALLVGFDPGFAGITEATESQIISPSISKRVRGTGCLDACIPPPSLGCRYVSDMRDRVRAPYLGSCPNLADLRDRLSYSKVDGCITSFLSLFIGQTWAWAPAMDGGPGQTSQLCSSQAAELVMHAVREANARPREIICLLGRHISSVLVVVWFDMSSGYRLFTSWWRRIGAGSDAIREHHSLPQLHRFVWSALSIIAVISSRATTETSVSLIQWACPWKGPCVPSFVTSCPLDPAPRMR